MIDEANNPVNQAANNPAEWPLQREMWVERDDKRIYGVLYLPEGASADAPRSAVICSHILAGSHVNSGRYARELASRGFVGFAFDFCGGSEQSRSTYKATGHPVKTTDHTIKTEAADLSAVLDAVRALPEVDERNVFLFGQSQGGAVSAMVAAARPDDVVGLILLYPAFVIHDLAVEMFGTPENAPDSYFLAVDLGRQYAVDAIEYDFYEHIGAFTGPVLMFQGTADHMEPKRFTDRAAEIYANVDYEVFEGVGHSFQGAVRRHVHDRVEAFINRVITR